MTTYEDAVRAWNEAVHPRVAAGGAGGGEFAPASSSTKSSKSGKGTRATPSNAHPVGMGEQGRRVSDLQKRLNALGAHLAVDGKFGPKTLAAVRAFQKSHGLKVDGLVGPKTTAALRQRPLEHKAAHLTSAKAPVKTSAPASPASAAKASRASGDSGIPGHFPHQLAHWWEHGEGAAKIRWGQGGDFDRCVRLAVDEAHMDPERAKGFCAERHHAALGIWPATHAAMDKKAARSTGMSDGYDSDGLDASWDGDLSGLPDLAGLGVADFEALDGSGPDAAASRMAKLGTGARFKALQASLAAKGASDPGALAAYIGRKKLGKARFAALAAKARKGAGAMARSDRLELFRSYPLEDAHIVRAGEGDSSGRLVEAYMAVFGEPTEIYDHQGHYSEDIDRAAFNKRIADLQRSRAGFGAAKVIYNHGMTIHGTPAERFSMPCAVTVDIRAESRGVITRARYLDTPLGNEVLEMWRSGAITAQSFTGAIIRSSPELPRGQKYRPRNGQLQRVTRLELGLKEYGPTPFPAYQGAELVGVRMSPLGTFAYAGDEDDQHDTDAALPPDEEAASGEPPQEHSARYHQHELYAIESRRKREEIGLVW